MTISLLNSKREALEGSITVFFGEDHLAAEGRELVVSGITDTITSSTGKLTIKDQDGTVVVDHKTSSSVDNATKTIKFELTAAEAGVFDLEKKYFFFAQAVFPNGHKITVKRGSVELLDSAESPAATPT